MSSDPTQQGEYRATVKEGADGTPFLSLEPAGADPEWIRSPIRLNCSGSISTLSMPSGICEPTPSP